MPNNDINKDKLLYIPKIEPVRNYESKRSISRCIYTY